VEVVTSYEFPDDAPSRIQAAHLALSQLADAPPIVPPSQIDATAEAAINAALGLPPDLLGVAPPVALELPPAPLGVAPPDTSHVAVTAEPQVMVTPQVAPQGADAKLVGGADNPTTAILVRNMFDKDEETEPNWEEEIRLDFEEECSKYGKLVKVVVMHKEEGGKIYAAFETIDGAKTCAFNLAGRWFDKRQLRVEFVPEESVPSSH
jgi:RNA-binding protein 39